MFNYSVVEGVDTAIGYDSQPFGFEVTFNWFDIPKEVQPDVPTSRLVRKQQQLENLSKPVIKVYSVYTPWDYINITLYSL